MRDLARQFIERVSAFCVVARSNSTPYWRLPGWFDLSFTLKPRIDAEQAYNGILAALGEGWERREASTEEEWAVWNASPGGRFFSRYVGWASVDRFPGSAMESPTDEEPE